MRQLFYSQQDLGTYPLVLLVPTIRKDEIQKEYLDPFNIPHDDVLVCDLHYSQEKKKTPAAEMKMFIESELVPLLQDSKAQYLIVSDSEYFKVLTKEPKAEANLGYVMDCVFGPWKVIYVPSYRAVFYDPVKVRSKIAQGMNAMLAHIAGGYEDPGDNIIKTAIYPDSYQGIQVALDMLLQMDCDLTVDIEAFDLRHTKAGIGTICFCWNQHEGVAFAVDYVPIDGATQAPFGYQLRNETVREMLRDFFIRFKRKMMCHNISYDAYNLIYQLFMKDILDTEGLLNGLEIMLKNWDDTKLITYLATNSCAGNKLGLKAQAQEFAGNYAEDEIVDITRIPLPRLLQYNLVDGLSTWYTYHRHWDTLVADQQEEIYQTLFKPATKDIIQMQLTGMPVNMKQILKVESILDTILQHSLQTIRGLKLIQEYEYKRLERFTEQKNAEWKKKRLTIQEMLDASKTSETIRKEISFNPNSGPQLQELLFDMLGMPIISYTDSKQPSTDRDTISALVHHSKTPEVKEFLLAMLDYKAVDKILTAFIPAMKNAALGPDGWHYLFGNFNLGGTLSGRLSSSDPNLQNLPANVEVVLAAVLLKMLEDLGAGSFIKKGKLHLGKLIKSCFEAPPGWLFCGLDFASLEDRISALTTKDPNKLKVYTDGYDGHCLRAHAYFGDQMPDIDANSVDSINSIDGKYKSLRQDSKAPTFALTYQGTFSTLMKNCGFSLEKAKMVERKYQQLYQVSIKWVQAKLDQAAKDGYITAAFGLRVRTPLLKQVIRGTSKTPHEAEAEGRSAGNALGQSWCLLNNRAGAEFMGGVRKSPHRLNIRPCAHIHDAQYMLVRDDIDAIMYANEHLVKAVSWQDHPDIWHDEVKIGGEFSIFYPTWGQEIGIPPGGSEEQIRKAISEAMA